MAKKYCREVWLEEKDTSFVDELQDLRTGSLRDSEDDEAGRSCEGLSIPLHGGEEVFGSCSEGVIRFFDEVAVDFQSNFSREEEYAPVRSGATHLE